MMIREIWLMNCCTDPWRANHWRFQSKWSDSLHSVDILNRLNRHEPTMTGAHLNPNSGVCIIRTTNKDGFFTVYDCDWFRVYHMTAHWILGHASMSKLSALRRPSNRQMSLVSVVKTMKNDSLRTPNFPSPTASPHSGRLPALQPASGMPIVLVYLETWPKPTRSSHRPGGESDGNLGKMTGAGVWCHFYIW
jgi:hypothetical protein